MPLDVVYVQIKTRKQPPSSTFQNRCTAYFSMRKYPIGSSDQGQSSNVPLVQTGCPNWPNKPILLFPWCYEKIQAVRTYVPFIRLSCLWFSFSFVIYNKLYLFKYNFSNNSRNIFDIRSIVYKYALKLCSFLVSGYTYLGSVLVVEPSVASGPKKR